MGFLADFMMRDVVAVQINSNAKGHDIGGRGGAEPFWQPDPTVGAVAGTVSVTSGSAAVTFTQNQTFASGAYLQFPGDRSAKGHSDIYRVQSGSGLFGTLTKPYGGNNASGIVAYTGVPCLVSYDRSRTTINHDKPGAITALEVLFCQLIDFDITKRFVWIDPATGKTRFLYPDAKSWATPITDNPSMEITSGCAVVEYSR